MLQTHWGELAALLTACFWTVTSLVFEAAGKRIGSLTLNLIRLYLAFLIYTVFLSFRRGIAFPVDAGSEAWIWLSLSGLVGFVVGDLLLFQAFVVIGARVSMLIMALVPPITALSGWLILGETLTPMNTLGMILTMGGISLVVLKREGTEVNGRAYNNVKFSYPMKGIFLALGGAFGQAVGLVLSKVGMKEYDPFAASQIRVLAGLLGFTLIFFILRRWENVRKGLKNRKGMLFTVIGAIFGPFLGVSFSLAAIQHTNTGIAATIMSIVPVLIIAPSVLIFKEKVNLKEILGAVIAVGGVALLFLL
ncbi:MAG: DMT family transporter [Bacteroidetes bacterium]|nr:DMT family transporter [Bacteroidota bacterium]